MPKTFKTGLVLSLVIAGAEASAFVTLDRIAVIVGNHAIKTSDIERDIRLTAFLNRQQLEFSPNAKRQSADRLVDQQLIRQEIDTGSYRRPPETEGATLESELIRDRFRGSQAEYSRTLERYGVTPAQLRAQLLWQVTVLNLIDQRFRAGVFVPDDQVHEYCQQHQAELRKSNPTASADAMESKCRNLLEGEQVSRNFDEWLKQQHAGTRVEYKQEAFL